MLTVLSLNAKSSDWEDIPVPADAGVGNVWLLQSLSDDFNYDAAANGKSDEFYSRWDEGFINTWAGPGMTLFSGDHASVSDGMLRLTTSRKAGTENVYTGAIHSNETVIYPLYLEARVKITNLTLANAFWLLSPDSTQEIDVIESYGSDREGQEWFDQRMHLSHHVFIREPFQDYQPKDSGSWVTNDAGTWRNEYYRIGVYWIDPWNLEYYIDGELVRTVSGEDIIDPLGYTDGSGLSKPMQVIFDVEQQDWREEAGIKATDEELADPQKNTFLIDWVRIYKPVIAESVVDTSTWTDGDITTVEFGDFVDTNKEGAAIESDTELGFNKSSDNINYNTVGDWGEYDVTFPSAGYYRVEYTVASETEQGLGITLSIDGVDLLSDSFAGTGDWGNYQIITASQTLYIETAGSKVVRIQSNGSSEWQWNGDEFSFTQLINPDSTPEETTPEESSDSSGGTVSIIWLMLLFGISIVRSNKHES
jgi:agarase